MMKEGEGERRKSFTLCGGRLLMGIFVIFHIIIQYLPFHARLKRGSEREKEKMKNQLMLRSGVSCKQSWVRVTAKTYLIANMSDFRSRDYLLFTVCMTMIN
jgi:hypothetical protein